MMSIAPQAPKLVARFGAHRVVPAGLALTGVGLGVFSFMTVDTVIWSVYIAVVPLATGMALTMTPLTTLIMSSVPLAKAGVGSAMNDTTRELGGALGVAVLGSVVTAQYASSLAPSIAALPAEAQSFANSGLSGALAVAERIGLDTPAGRALADAGRSAFVDGMGWSAVVGAGVVLLAATLAWFLLPKGTEIPQGAREGVPGDDDAAGDVIDEGILVPSPILD